MKTVKLIFIVWATLLVSVFAQANERIQIELDEHFRRGGVIKLKQEIKNIYPNIPFSLSISQNILSSIY